VAEARDAALPAALGGVSAGARRPASERALVRAAQGGSAEAMEEIFRRHWPRAHRAAWLVVHDAAAAEDVAREAFLAAVRSLEHFDRRRPFGRGCTGSSSNRAVVSAWAREVRREVPADAVAEAAGRAGGGACEAPSDDVLGALAALAPDQRAVIVMRHLLGFTPGEIGRGPPGLPRETVNSRLRCGLDALADPLCEEARS
jgi:RNA polymerase sigma-70 factor (ECF subfamily)